MLDSCRTPSFRKTLKVPLFMTLLFSSWFFLIISGDTLRESLNGMLSVINMSSDKGSFWGVSKICWVHWKERLKSVRRELMLELGNWKGAGIRVRFIGDEYQLVTWFVYIISWLGRVHLQSSRYPKFFDDWFHLIVYCISNFTMLISDGTSVAITWRGRARVFSKY